jgi:hypothetical protein
VTVVYDLLHFEASVIGFNDALEYAIFRLGVRATWALVAREFLAEICATQKGTKSTG